GRRRRSVSRFFFLVTRRAPLSTLFPYTTLFRSTVLGLAARGWSVLAVDRVADDPALRYPMATPADLSTVTTRAGGLVSRRGAVRDRKSTRLNSSHVKISYAVFCLKKKTKTSSDH